MRDGSYGARTPLVHRCRQMNHSYESVKLVEVSDKFCAPEQLLVNETAWACSVSAQVAQSGWQRDRLPGGYN